jgi:hypothetical protein
MPSPYAAQIVVDNNISVSNGGPGIKVYNNSRGSAHALIYVRHNTLWGNNSDPNEPNGYCAESVVGAALNVQQFFNIAATNATKACAGYAPYAYFTWNGGPTDLVYSNVGWAASGTYAGIDNSPGFFYSPDNLFGTNPSFVNAMAPPAPTCRGASSVPRCMATLIANFAPTTAAAIHFGYQIPLPAQTYDPLFPQWLCNVNLPAGLVTMGCVAFATPDLTRDYPQK